jgi:hypothetical protein
LDSEGVHAVTHFDLVDSLCDGALRTDRTRSNAGVSIVASANSNPKGRAGQSNQVRIVEEENESDGNGT